MTDYDVLKDPKFRRYVIKKISKSTKDPNYTFPTHFPLLCRYTKLSHYSIEDIINEQVTATIIGEFNDIFDGAIHKYQSKDDMDAVPEKEWNELKKIYEINGFELSDQSKDEYFENKKTVVEEHNHNAFYELDYLGTYICCFSTHNDSTLMWSHYAGANTGMCITYDFNQWADTNLLRSFLFPIEYTEKPIIIPDIMQETDECEHPVIANVLATALCKAEIWKYEHEWRLLLLLPFLNYNNKRICRMPIKIKCIPAKVCFGFHFLKQFFYQNNNEIQSARSNIEEFQRLLSFLTENEIPTSIITPEIGGYKLIPSDISIENLHQFMSTNFKDNSPEKMKYYHMIQGELLKLLERK